MGAPPGGDPEGAARALKERGTDLLLVNYPMLLRWKNSGWLDPRIDLPTLDGMLRLLPVEFNWPNGEFLFRLGDPPMPAQSAPEEPIEVEE